jgi:mannose-6-phosphate isomerase-like protein (cupin superfamily)
MNSNVITNGAGEQMRFLRTSANTDGAVVEFEATIEPGTQGPPAHVHLKQEERFTVLRGTMAVRVGHEELILRPGDQHVVPAGVAHTWRLVGDETLVARAELRPALRFEEFIRDAFAMLAANGGRLDPSKVGPILAKYQDEYRFASAEEIQLEEIRI